MRKDLDRLMHERDIDAILIPGTEGENPQRAYLSKNVHASAIVVKKRDADPVLIVNGMEIEEAQKSGYQVHTFDDFNWMEIIKEHGRGTPIAQAKMWQRILDTLNIKGRVAFFGSADMQYAYRTYNALQEHLTGIEIVEDKNPDMFSVAYLTKDPDELEALRESGRKTSLVIRDTIAWLKTHKEQDGQVVDANGKPLTIGDVKRYIRVALLNQDMEDAEGMIFAQGRDGGFPHSRGEADEILRTGEAIVFDLFPRPIGGGYHHDVTRTWSLGYAKPEVQAAFDTVQQVFGNSLEGITIGEMTKNVSTQVCEWFEALGHPTRLSTPNTQVGYMHSLGHGIGLNVHEGPSMSHLSPDSTVFQAGNVVTVEPGLYYPEKGFGIRIEDTVYIREDGSLDNLTDVPYDLVIPLEG